VTAGEGMRPGCLMKILEAERWLKGTNFREVCSSNDKAEGLRVFPIRGLGRWKDAMHRRSAKTWLPFKGVTLLLKVTLPTCILSHRRLSLLQPAPRSSPYDTGAGSHASCKLAQGRRSMQAKPCLLDYGTSTATRGNPAYDPTVPARHVGHGSVSRGRKRDGRNGQKWAGSKGGGRRAEAAVKSSAKLMSPPGTAREPSPTA
jgi:hypothetical protein